jgi:hypothetical protein
MEESFDFDNKEKMIEAFKQISTDQVNQKFKSLFLQNPKRLNIKLHSEEHLPNKEESEKAKDENEAFYKKHGVNNNKISNPKFFEMAHPKFSKRKFR